MTTHGHGYGPPLPEGPTPLAAAKARLTKPRPRRLEAQLTVHQEGMAMGMRAVGVPVAKVAAALEVKASVITDIVVAHPDLKDKILDIRDKLKLTKMQKALLLEERLWNLADTLVSAEDAKGVDGVLRAIHASEKIQQAVAGESQKVEVTGVPAQDLAGLIQVLIQQS